jgi:putative transposase
LPLNHYAFDITYIPTDEGWLFLAAIKDFHTCEIVGWAMDSRMTKALVVDALRAAYWRKKPKPGLAHHLTVEASIAAAHTVHYKSAMA